MPERDEASLIDILAEEVAERAVIDYRDQFNVLSQACESPIERVLLAALLIERPQGIAILKFNGKLLPREDLFLLDSGYDDEDIGGLYLQAELGLYRVDFYLEVFDKRSREQWFRAAIECDGHEFHERTKEQARRDKRRDRWFQTKGIQVIRFTGSEIWKDPLACADEAFEVFWAASRRRRGVEK